MHNFFAASFCLRNLMFDMNHRLHHCNKYYMTSSIIVVAQINYHSYFMVAAFLIPHFVLVARHQSLFGHLWNFHNSLSNSDWKIFAYISTYTWCAMSFTIMAILVVNQQYDIYSLTLIRNLNGQIFPLVIRKKTFYVCKLFFSWLIVTLKPRHMLFFQKVSLNIKKASFQIQYSKGSVLHVLWAALSLFNLSFLSQNAWYFTNNSCI
jgi:hypothetical protein